MIKKIMIIAMCVFALVGTVRAEILSDEDFDQFMTFYYKTDPYEEIPAVLDYFLSSDLFLKNKASDPHIIEMVAYFFGRVSEEHPHLVRTYQELFEQSTEDNQKFLLMIFAFYRDSVTTDYLQTFLADHPDSANKRTLETVLANEPLKKASFIGKVQGYNDIDYLWLEYFITGSEESVKSIINVLTWKDVFSIRLLDWMLKEKSEDEIELMTNLLKQSIGIEVDVDALSTDTKQDLDILFSAFLQYSGTTQELTGLGSAIRQGLELSDEDVLWMATKGSATWSLQSNAQRHEGVMAILKAEAETRKDKSATEIDLILSVFEEGLPDD